MRAEFVSSGTSVTGVQFARSQTVTTSNHQLLISYEVVTLSDGSTVQTGTGRSPGRTPPAPPTINGRHDTRGGVLLRLRR